MRPIDLLLALTALLGHAAICVGVLNRSHAVGVSRKLVKSLTVLAFLLVPLLPAVALWPRLSGRTTPAVLQVSSGGAGWWLAYLIPCWFAAVVVVVRWVRRELFRFQPGLLQSNHTLKIDIAERLGQRPVHGMLWRALTRLPGNQDFIVHFHEKSLELPRLDPALDGLSILHLSDFHFTGRIGKEFFQELTRLAMESPPDLIALTGDFVDNADCIDWIPDALGALTARYGVYFILGNHDPRMGQVPRLRRALVDVGFVDLAGRWLKLDINGRSVVLAGNEMPWIPPAPDMRDCPAEIGGVRPLRLLLAHTPDQLPWARRHDFDLMLAGHTHGGQIRLPWIGPIFCPSRHGLEYAAGVFHEPPTVLHVSRGVSGETPSRWFCPPEIARLVLRSATRRH
jgi:uncharacterized protein